MKYVNKPVRKKDAMQLVTGQPVYMDGCDESGRDRGDLYLGRYPAGREAVHAGRTDISGDESV